MPDLRSNDGRLLAIVQLGLVTHFAKIGDVSQQFVEIGFGERLAATFAAFAQLSSAW